MPAASAEPLLSTRRTVPAAPRAVTPKYAATSPWTSCPPESTGSVHGSRLVGPLFRLARSAADQPSAHIWLRTLDRGDDHREPAQRERHDVKIGKNQPRQPNPCLAGPYPPEGADPIPITAANPQQYAAAQHQR